MSSLTQKLPNGEEHGLVNTIGNSVPDSGFKRFAEKDRAAMEKEKLESSKIVKRMYLNSRQGKETLERPYMKYEGQPITLWKFIHGHTYDVPKGLADEVNKQPALAKRSEIVDSNGTPTAQDGQGEKLHRLVMVE